MGSVVRLVLVAWIALVIANELVSAGSVCGAADVAFPIGAVLFLIGSMIWPLFTEAACWLLVAGLLLASTAIMAGGAACQA